MRGFAVVVLAVLVVAQVYGFGVATSKELREGYELDVGDEEVLEFFVRGDEERQDVVFFVRSSGGGLEFDGESVYEEEFVMEAFESRDIEIVMEAVGGGEFVVTWGYVVKPFGEDPMFEQVTERMFVVEVDGPESEEEEDMGNGGGSDDGIDVEVDSSGGAGGSGGVGSGGSGGSGALVLSQDAENENKSGVVDNGDDARVRDVSPQQSSLTEARVDEGRSGPGVSSVPSIAQRVVDEGKVFLLIVLGIGLMALGVAGANVWVVKNHG